jgi:hypothetical protein
MKIGSFVGAPMDCSQDGWAWKEISFSEWRRGVDEKLVLEYGITIEDAGIDDEYLIPHWQMKQSPYEFVEWFGIKYDLTSRSEIEWGSLANP